MVSVVTKFSHPKQGSLGNLSQEEVAVTARYSDIILWGIVGFGMLLLWSGCSPTVEPGSRHPAKQKEVAMQPENQTAHSPATIPVIDAEAPRVFDTATFGLG